MCTSDISDAQGFDLTEENEINTLMGSEFLQNDTEFVASGLNLSILYEKLKASKSNRLNALAQKCKSFIELKASVVPGSLLLEIRETLMEFKVKTFKGFVNRLDLACCAYLLRCSDTLPFSSLVMLQRIFLMVENFTWETSFEHIHFIAKTLMETMKDSGNIISFANAIHTISQLGFYLSITLIWSLVMTTLEIEITVHQMYEFNELIRMLRDFDLEQATEHSNIVLILVNCISFMLRTVHSSSIYHKSWISHSNFQNFFVKERQDVLELIKWADKLREKFPPSLQCFSSCQLAIREIIVFEILCYQAKVDAPPQSPCSSLSDSDD